MAINEEKVIVRVENVSKSFGDNKVLCDITMQIAEGEIVAIIGPSGSGKSTLLRCMTMLDRFDNGTLTYGDLVICTPGENNKAKYSDAATMREAKSCFGLVFQSFNLFPHFTVLQNVTDAPIHVQKRDKKQVEAEARELLKKVGLEGKEDMVPCELSGGQKQRVAIARALALRPDVLYFDEPTSALDPELTKEVLNVIKELAEENMTMVIVTHDMAFARDVANGIVFMEGGYIVERGPADQMVNHPKHKRTQEFLASMSNQDKNKIEKM